MSPRRKRYLWFGALYLLSLIAYAVAVFTEKGMLHLLR